MATLRLNTTLIRVEIVDEPFNRRLSMANLALKLDSTCSKLDGTRKVEWMKRLGRMFLLSVTLITASGLATHKATGASLSTTSAAAARAVVGIAKSLPNGRVRLEEVSTTGTLVKVLIARSIITGAAVTADGRSLIYDGPGTGQQLPGIYIWRKDLSTGAITRLTEGILAKHRVFSNADTLLALSPDDQYVYFFHDHPFCLCTPPPPGPELWKVPISASAQGVTAATAQQTAESQIGPPGGATGRAIVGSTMLSGDFGPGIDFVSLTTGRIVRRLIVRVGTTRLSVEDIAVADAGTRYLVNASNGEGLPELYAVNARTGVARSFPTAPNGWYWAANLTANIGGYFFAAQGSRTRIVYNTFKCSVARLTCRLFLANAQPYFVARDAGAASQSSTG